jgi:alkylhydroperoxidase/carboxymuconolactone decarboxylase family protein YurZ
MAISETARQNHDELFPGHVSTLAVTDPELIEVFDNFAFDEALAASGLDARTRLMVQLAALIGCQALSEYRVMLGAALTAGVTPVEAREIVYQAVPYTGMGKVFDFLHATNDVLTERGVRLPSGGRCSVSSPCSCRLSAIPAPSTPWRPSTRSRPRSARTRRTDRGQVPGSVEPRSVRHDGLDLDLTTEQSESSDSWHAAAWNPIIGL